jgi:hypothetical protein
MVAVGKDNGRAVARGDDFCALLGVARAEGAEGVAARAAERLAAGRYSVGGLAVASVRVAVGAPSRAATVEGRLRQADRVMETDPDVVVVVMVLRREDGSSVAAFGALGATVGSIRGARESRSGRA